MSISELRLIKNVLEYQPKENIPLVPIKTRGIYALYQEQEVVNSMILYMLAWHGEENEVFGEDSAHITKENVISGHIFLFMKFGTIFEKKKLKNWKACFAISSNMIRKQIV